MTTEMNSHEPESQEAEPSAPRRPSSSSLRGSGDLLSVSSTAAAALRPFMRTYRRHSGLRCVGEVIRALRSAGAETTDRAQQDLYGRDGPSQSGLESTASQLRCLLALVERHRLLPEVIEAMPLHRPFRVGGWRAQVGDYLVCDDHSASAMSAEDLLSWYQPLDQASVPPGDLTSWSCGVAAGLLAPLGNRWRHTVAVASQAERLGALLPEPERRVLVAAAYLHDIGYAPQLASTGCHPLDGANALLGLVPDRVAALVAHHSGAYYQAAWCGLAPELAAFPREQSAVSDALVYCDLTSGPDGRRMTVDERLTEIRQRYGADHIVMKALTCASAELKEAAARIEALLHQHKLSGDRGDVVADASPIAPAGSTRHPAGVSCPTPDGRHAVVPLVGYPTVGVDSALLSLTPLERQVAALVAVGRRNVQIATDLLMTSGAVRNHVYRIRRKTGLRSRAALAAAWRASPAGTSASMRTETGPEAGSHQPSGEAP